MKYIAVEIRIVEYMDENGVAHEMRVNNPAEPLPPNSVRNVYDSANQRYVCYEPGDVLPD